jgi:hypothetical protein
MSGKHGLSDADEVPSKRMKKEEEQDRLLLEAKRDLTQHVIGDLANLVLSYCGHLKLLMEVSVFRTPPFTIPPDVNLASLVENTPVGNASEIQYRHLFHLTSCYETARGVRASTLLPVSLKEGHHGLTAYTTYDGEVVWYSDGLRVVEYQRRSEKIRVLREGLDSPLYAVGYSTGESVFVDKENKTLNVVSCLYSDSTQVFHTREVATEVFCVSHRWIIYSSLWSPFHILGVDRASKRSYPVNVNGVCGGCLHSGIEYSGFVYLTRQRQSCLCVPTKNAEFSRDDLLRVDSAFIGF